MNGGGTLQIGIRGTFGAPALPRLEPLKCPACGKPFAEGTFGPGTRIMVKCGNRRCLAHQKETMITVFPAAEKRGSAGGAGEATPT